MSTRTRFPELNGIQDKKIESWANELVRSLRDFDLNIFAPKLGILYQTARITPFVEVSSGYAVGINDAVILADSSASAIEVVLPLANTTKGRFFNIKKTDAGALTTVTVSASGPEFPYVLSGVSRPDINLFSTGTQYFIL